MQATSLPQPCANCSKVAAHMNDAKGGDSPPSESKMDSKKAKDDSNKRMKEDSKREAASKKEEKHVERKANLLKQLKTQKEEKEKRGGKIRTSGEPFGTPPQPSPTVADQTKELPHLAPDI
uniref:Uncharacterized protein n=1 Tax=Panagrolaimus superbus TaxID=310955 RepID=A0A914Y866_9BILA